MQLEARVAFVTGAASGIGQASALLLAKEGAKIAALDQDLDKLSSTVSLINSQGGEVLAIAADVTQPHEMEQAVRQVIEHWGRLDIVFANAGINGVWAPLEELSPDEWDRTIDTNLKGTFLTVKYAVPHLKRSGGSVIVTSSVNGTRVFSNTGATAYSCSKAAQVAFVKMVALELAEHLVRVNVICPGLIDTNIDQSTQKRGVEDLRPPVEYPRGFVPLNRGQPGTSAQVAQLVLFLASDASDHITGTELWIDGAESLLKG